MVLIWLVIFSLVLIYWLLFRKPGLSMPGPSGWPIVGCIFQMRDVHSHVTFSRWAKEYGSVYAVDLFRNPVVFVNSYDTIYDVLVKRGDEFADRATNFRLALFTRMNKDLVTSHYSSPHRYVMRKLIQTHIKLVGTGREEIENIIASVIENQTKKYSSYRGEAFNIHAELYHFAQSITYSLVFGEELEKNSKIASMFLELDEKINRSMQVGGSGVLLDKFPWFRLFGNRVYEDLKTAMDLTDSLYEIHRQKFLNVTTKSRSNCIFNTLMQLARSGSSDIEEINVKLTVANLLVAGSRTTSTTLSGFLSLLLNYQEVQRELQQEVDTVVGKHRRVTLNVRDAMPYTRAAIYELLRYTSITPLGLLHAATKDTTINEYFIPKGTTVCTNLWTLHHDVEFWGDPWNYRPERYLDETGNLLPADHPNRKHLLAFGAGPKVCLGEVFALNRLFLFIASLVQRFDVHPEKDHELPSCNPLSYLPSIVPYPIEFRVRLVPRE